MMLTTAFRPNAPQVIHETIDGEVILINLETGAYFSLDNVGAVLWSLLVAQLPTHEIVRTLLNRYDGAADEIESAVLELLATLEQEALIVSAEQPGQSTGDSTPEGVREPFTTPTLKKYTDMQELIQLDPIHEVDETGWPHRHASSLVAG